MPTEAERSAPYFFGGCVAGCWVGCCFGAACCPADCCCPAGGCCPAGCCWAGAARGGEGRGTDVGFIPFWMMLSRLSFDPGRKKIFVTRQSPMNTEARIVVA